MTEEELNKKHYLFRGKLADRRGEIFSNEETYFYEQGIVRKVLQPQDNAKGYKHLVISFFSPFDFEVTNCYAEYDEVVLFEVAKEEWEFIVQRYDKLENLIDNTDLI